MHASVQLVHTIKSAVMSLTLTFKELAVSSIGLVVTVPHIPAADGAKMKYKTSCMYVALRTVVLCGIYLTLLTTTNKVCKSLQQQYLYRSFPYCRNRLTHNMTTSRCVCTYSVVMYMLIPLLVVRRKHTQTHFDNCTGTILYFAFISKPLHAAHVHVENDDHQKCK